MSDERRRRRRRPATGGPWVHGGILACFALGPFIGPDTGPSEAELRQRERCQPIEWRSDLPSDQWSELIDQGYVVEGDELIPPGCESVR